MTAYQILALLALALLLGLRHGIDWDHLAAIADIAGAAESRSRGMFLGTMYALGHASVVVVLGAAATMVGVLLPEWVDGVLERVVGVTLIVLGLWVFYALWRYPHSFRLRSRWMLIFAGVSYVWQRIKAKMGEPNNGSAHLAVGAPSIRLSYFVGVIHGIGAETATQVLLFVSAAGVGHTAVGLLAVLSFVAGLMISNSFITLGAALGYLGSGRHLKLQQGLGAVTGTFSLLVGILFLLGAGGGLPVFLGG